MNLIYVFYVRIKNVFTKLINEFKFSIVEYNCFKRIGV